MGRTVLEKYLKIYRYKSENKFVKLPKYIKHLSVDGTH